jgi:hypothetical protein
MLVACRLAGLSALETYHASLIAFAQCRPTRSPNASKPSRRARQRKASAADGGARSSNIPHPTRRARLLASEPAVASDRASQRPSMARARLAALALMRRQELDSFIEGLFGREEVVDPPKRADRGFDELGQMRAPFEAVARLAEDDTKQPTEKAVETTLRRMREMTKIYA